MRQHLVALLAVLGLATTGALAQSTQCVLASSTQQCSALNVCPGGQCCSQYGWCGTTTAHCATGCLSQCDRVAIPNLATCSVTPTTVPVPAGSCVLPAGSTQCSATRLCPGGQCCSPYGWCGTTVDHCGTGCLGQCDKKAVTGLPTCGAASSSSASSSTAPATTSTSTRSATVSSTVSATTTTIVSTTTTTTTTAAPTSTFTLGSRCIMPVGSKQCSALQLCPSGQCCSLAGWCGTTADYCGNGCQGQCDKKAVAGLPKCGSTTVTPITLPPTKTVTPAAGVCLLPTNAVPCSETQACPGGVCCGPNNRCSSGVANCAKALGCKSQCDGEVFVGLPGCGLTTVDGVALAYLPTPVADPRTFTPATDLPAPNFELGPNGELNSCGWPGMLAITYDDGPGVGTARILDAFLAAGAKTTFYWLGKNVAAQPALAQRAVAEGHQVAHHTYDHFDISTLTLLQVRDQMSRTEAAIQAAIGLTPRFFRPPYGIITAASYQLIAGELGYTVSVWNSDTSDWEASATVEGIEQYYRSWVRNPSQRSWVLLAHDIQDHTGAVAPSAIRISRENGFKLVRMAECLNKRPYAV
ncbi:hypothetical protein H9P43_008666 [Blastocladiella emersonii ATCC 22665]|nr:hypothetical protein H9P43_008666 [Blastocladiella emersonii ATCC 22665]